MPSSSKTLHVRLKPYNPKRGYVMRRFTYRGVRIIGDRGWYRVDLDTAKYLKTVYATPGDEDTPLAFDVCTEEEAKRIDAEEQKEREKRRAAANAINASAPAQADRNRKGRA